MLTLDETIESISAKLLGMHPGQLAELRRMEPEGTGTPMFWRMAAQYEFQDADLNVWKRIVRILALLTPRGTRSADVRLHERSRRLGTVLCDGGDSAWPPKGPDPSPVLSELRLARFLATPADQRGEALERIARMLSRRRNAQRGVNCVEIARLLLYPSEAHPLQDVARNYYSRLDRAAYQSKNEEGTV
jgi:CRISPR system Cascade subunit CasB